MDKKIALFLIALLGLTSISFSGDSPANPGLTVPLSERKIEGISIMLPGYLSEKTLKNGKNFQDTTDEMRSIAVLIDDSPLEDSLKNAVSSKYEFWEKTYQPGSDPILIVLNKMYKAGFREIEKMETVDLQSFHGFVTKGIRNTAKGDSYTFDYILFQKGNNQKQINVAIQSLKGYFLSDTEADYIISTLKTVN